MGACCRKAAASSEDIIIGHSIEEPQATMICGAQGMDFCVTVVSPAHNRTDFS